VRHHAPLCHDAERPHARRRLRGRQAAGFPLSTRRFLLYQAGCHGGGTALRLAKDLAENNPGAPVLVVCSEVITMALRGPSETHIGNLVGQALFGDAAGAAVDRAGPAFAGEERPVFEMVLAWQDIIPGTEGAVVSELREEGIVYTRHPDVALHISSNVERLVKAVLRPIAGDKDRNEELFWVVHPGGRDILNMVESRLGAWGSGRRSCRW
jgi:chalcone synthase